MIDIKSFKTGGILKSPHFWIVTCISLLIMFIYYAWPWRVWQLTHGIWQYFPWLSFLYPLARFESANHLLGILFFLPIVYAAIVFSWQITLVASLIAIAGILPEIIGYWQLTSVVTNVIILILPLMIILITNIELERRKQNRKHLADRERERKTYISKIIESEEKERKLISQDLHDDILQSLTAITYNLNSLISNDHSLPEPLRQKVESIKDLTNTTIDDTRRICKRLRPSVLDTMGMVPALRWLVETTNSHGSVDTRIVFKGTERRLPDNLETALFRILQEALFNIRRHSKARNAVVTLDFAEDEIRIMIQDDGQGFLLKQRLDSLALDGKLGLMGIKQRVESFNGEFEIFSTLGEGTRLLIKVPKQS